MLKLIIPLILLSISLYSNEVLEKQLNDCEDSYLSCVTKCEENEDTNMQECIGKCEDLYYVCESKVLGKEDEK